MDGYPMSPDINALDVYLWGHLNVKVYQVKIQNLDYLKEGIRDACASIKPDMLK
jgi:hypothetical protein